MTANQQPPPQGCRPASGRPHQSPGAAFRRRARPAPARQSISKHRRSVIPHYWLSMDVHSGSHTSRPQSIYRSLRLNDRIDVQSDPIGLLGGVNTYAYVDADPLMGIDPKGRFAIHGNWCGPNWTGGRTHPYIPMPLGYYGPAVDPTDLACQSHDICHYVCRTDFPCKRDERGHCMVRCDRQLASELPWGMSSGTSLERTWLIWLWTNFNIFPGPDPNDPSCPNCGS